MSFSIALWRKTGCSLRNAGRILLAQSRFKGVFVFCFAALCEAGLWLLFASGFRFLDGFGALGGMVVGRLFSFFFFGLGIMLAASSVLTSYATLFRSDEIGFLLSRPVSISNIVVYKFVEAAILSSWAFFFVVLPFVGAYAWHEQLSPLFLLWTLFFSAPFVLICSGAGTVAVLLVVRYLPRKAGMRALTVAVATCAGLLLWWITREVKESSANVQFVLSRLVPGMMVASHPLMPSAWIADGLMALGPGGRRLDGIALLGMLTTTALALGVCVEWMGSRWYFDGWQHAQIGSGARRRRGRWMAGLDRALRFVAKDVRAMVMKDVRTFLRDPMQWSQSLIFFGLLALYFSNLRPANFDLLGERWKNMMIFLNVFSVASVTCSLGARFVYPQLSLEGHGFWMLGLAPTSMARVVMTKFAGSSLGLVCTGVALMLLASYKLEVGAVGCGVGAALAAAVGFAVCGLSTGLGAVFLDLKERNPAAIVSGFGGTLNLVLSLVFLLGAILPLAVLFHVHAAYGLASDWFRFGMIASGLWLVVLTSLATALPLWLGIRSLSQRDF